MAMANSSSVDFGICLTAFCESILGRIDFQCIDFYLSAFEPRWLALMATLYCSVISALTSWCFPFPFT